MSSTAVSAAPDASLFVPFTQTFVQTSGSETTTVEYTLVGQVLENGQTNWVGYDEGGAEYLYTGSVANAQQTTLAGEVYYVSSGDAPAGYIATASGDEGSMTTQAAESDSPSSTSDSGDDSSVTESSSPTESESSSNTGSGASAETSQPNNSHRMSAGAAFALAVGLLAVIAL
ncbi:hypothetical protein CBER1_08409 [Cercospora berteroae]|uniref:Uncharacterized protein n=1 Tax=Cercospora berteroae TaxID=357750 RepID=A0A2S6BV87_9PEZI|nr:hypothetical protein CBER1_08409 [Cercospora berteroae]